MKKITMINGEHGDVLYIHKSCQGRDEIQMPSSDMLCYPIWDGYISCIVSL